MAGFGAGFAKAISDSLDSAGKLFQEEQLRTREYERARADKKADVADEREYQSGVRAEERTYEERRSAERQAILDEANPDRISMSGGKYYYTTRAGEVVEKGPNDPIVKAYLRVNEDRAEEKADKRLSREVKYSQIAANRESAATSRHGRQDKPLNLFAELAPSQREIVKAIAKFGPYANISDGKGGTLRVTKEMVSAARALESSKNPAAAYQAAADLKDVLTDYVVGPAPARKEGEPDNRTFASPAAKPAPAAASSAFNATPGWSLNNYRK